jgi:hypothetical protein
VEPIFDAYGVVVAWFSRDVLYDLHGYAVAFIRYKAVYGYDGVQVGFFSDGLFREGYGNVVAFMRNAQGGPLRPIPRIPPIPPIPQIPPIPPIPDIPVIPPIPTLNWSQMNWEQFLN